MIFNGDEYWQQIDIIVNWLDHNPPIWGDSLQWRIGKIAEEYGEVQAALIELSQANPRKQISDKDPNIIIDSVTDELCDVIVTACVALKTMIPNQSAKRLSQRVETLLNRINVVEATNV